MVGLGFQSKSFTEFSVFYRFANLRTDEVHRAPRRSAFIRSFFYLSFLGGRADVSFAEVFAVFVHIHRPIYRGRYGGRLS
jgi:hypothetical protein